MSIESMLVGLVNAKVDFVVIGGVAGVVQGSPHSTNDLDICYSDSEANVSRLAKLLEAWKAYPKEWEPGLPFFMDAKTFRTTPTMTLQTAEGQLDVLSRVEGVGNFDECRAQSVEISAFRLAFRVLKLEALIASKRAAGRSKDLAVLPTLEALLDLEKESEA